MGAVHHICWFKNSLLQIFQFYICFVIELERFPVLSYHLFLKLMIGLLSKIESDKFWLMNAVGSAHRWLIYITTWLVARLISKYFDYIVKLEQLSL